MRAEPLQSWYCPQCMGFQDATENLDCPTCGTPMELKAVGTMVSAPNGVESSSESTPQLVVVILTSRPMKPGDHPAIPDYAQPGALDDLVAVPRVLYQALAKLGAQMTASETWKYLSALEYPGRTRLGGSGEVQGAFNSLFDRMTPKEQQHLLVHQLYRRYSPYEPMRKAVEIMPQLKERRRAR